MKKILIVEDDPVVSLVYQTHLSREGYEVEVARDGEAGLAQMEQACPSAVLLDLMLPTINGVEILKEMRVQPQLAQIPVIVLTNAYVPQMISGAMQAGATKVLNKAEVNPHLVVEALKNAGCFPNEN